MAYKLEATLSQRGGARRRLNQNSGPAAYPLYLTCNTVFKAAVLRSCAGFCVRFRFGSVPYPYVAYCAVRHRTQGVARYARPALLWSLPPPALAGGGVLGAFLNKKDLLVSPLIIASELTSPRGSGCFIWPGQAGH